MTQKFFLRKVCFLYIDIINTFQKKKKRENLRETRVESRKCHYVLGKSSPQSFCVLISIKGIIYFSHKSVMMAQLHIMVCNFLWSAKRKMKEANLRMSPVMSPRYVSTTPESLLAERRYRVDELRVTNGIHIMR